MQWFRISLSSAALAAALFSPQARAEDMSENLPAEKFSGEDYNPDPGAGKNYAFMVHPILSLAISGVHVSLEGPFGEGRWAYEVPFYLGYSEHVYSNPTLFLGSGLGIRRYLVSPGKGTFVSPELEVVNIHRFKSGTDKAENVVVTVPSMSMGFKWRWQVATLEAGVGFAYISANVTRGNWLTEENRFTGLYPMGHFSAGIPF